MDVTARSVMLLVVYFFYGLAFFIMGFAMAMEGQRVNRDNALARAVIPLSVFGLLHGGHEWLEVFILDARIHGLIALPMWLDAVRVLLLAVSFTALIAFAVQLLYTEMPPVRTGLYVGVGMLAFWLTGVLALGILVQPGNLMRLTVRSWLMMADTWSRYVLAVPGALLSAYALWREARRLRLEQRPFDRHFYVAAGAFLLYGLVGQVFISQTYLFPSNVLNAALFERWFHFPVQLFRASMAAVLALTLIPALNMFELERRQMLAAAEQRVRDELARRESLRRDMLRHTVAAQEEERQRIARELHDEIGQTLTALSLGLGNLVPQVLAGNNALLESVEQLRSLTADAVAELHNLVTDLRPSQLDHLGLKAALRMLARQYQERFGLTVNLVREGERRRLPQEVELAVFRIAQEALTNVVRHAGVTEAEIVLSFEPDSVVLCIKDRGQGFDPGVTQARQETHREHWGLLGMSERAIQLDGTLKVEACPGQGTCITARLPLSSVESVGE